jgi:hypothetical protein
MAHLMRRWFQRCARSSSADTTFTQSGPCGLFHALCQVTGV